MAPSQTKAGSFVPKHDTVKGSLRYTLEIANRLSRLTFTLFRCAVIKSDASASFAVFVPFCAVFFCASCIFCVGRLIYVLLCIFEQPCSFPVFIVFICAIVYIYSPVIWACDNTHWLVPCDCRPVLFECLGRESARVHGLAVNLGQGTVLICQLDEMLFKAASDHR